MSPVVNVSRREFLQAGAGLTLAVMVPGAAAQSGPGKTLAMTAEGAFAPNAFVRISPDDVVTVIAKHLEMGQGTYTGLATLVAEELDADWAQVRVEGAPADAARYNNLFWGQAQGTGGSTAIANSYEQMRKAGAAARAMLVAAAAKRWKVPAESIRVSHGVLTHASGKRASFGALAEAAAALPVPKEVALKDPKRFVYIGKHVTRVDRTDKSNGAARFTQDVKLPGLLTALVAHPPRFGGKPKSFDASRAKQVKGVVDVVGYETPVWSGVAVLAEDYWAAKKGRDALSVEWDESAAFRLGSAQIMAEYKRLAGSPGAVARNEGDADRALAGAARVLEASYEFPYLAHASMEPINCVVRLDADGAEVWNGEQFQTGDQYALAKLLGLKPGQVKIHQLYAGGSFGRRANPLSDYLLEAAAICKAAGGQRPVKLVWSREDDMRGGFYRPMYYHALKAGLDAKGNLVAWTHRIVGQSILAGTAFESAMVKGRHLGGGRGQPAVCDSQPARGPALAEDGRAGAVVALGGLHAHRVFDRDLPRRGGARGAQGPGGAAPRAAREAPAAPRRARAGCAARRLGQGARPGARARRRRARVLQHLRGAGGRGLPPQGGAARRARGLRGGLRRRGQSAHRAAADGVGDRLRALGRPDGGDHIEGGRSRAVEFPRLHGAAHAPDASDRGAHRALGREAHGGRRARYARHWSGARQCPAWRHGQAASPSAADRGGCAIRLKWP